MCLFKTYTQVRIDKHLFHRPTLPIQGSLKQGLASSQFLFNFSLEYATGSSKKTKRDWNWMGHISFLSMLTMLIYEVNPLKPNDKCKYQTLYQAVILHFVFIGSV